MLWPGGPKIAHAVFILGPVTFLTAMPTGTVHYRNLLRGPKKGQSNGKCWEVEGKRK